MTQQMQDLIVRKVADGYHPGKSTWAVVTEGPYWYVVVESGFPLKRDALAWIAASQKVKGGVV